MINYLLLANASEIEPMRFALGFVIGTFVFIICKICGTRWTRSLLLAWAVAFVVWGYIDATKGAYHQFDKMSFQPGDNER